MNEKTFDKNVFTWVFAFLLGSFGVDRFMRGQILFGILKLITCWIFFWWLIDWIIAMVKAYGKDHYGNDKEFVFVDGKWTK